MRSRHSPKISAGAATATAAAASAVRRVAMRATTSIAIQNAAAESSPSAAEVASV